MRGAQEKDPTGAPAQGGSFFVGQQSSCGELTRLVIFHHFHEYILWNMYFSTFESLGLPLLLLLA